MNYYKQYYKWLLVLALSGCVNIPKQEAYLSIPSKFNAPSNLEGAEMSAEQKIDKMKTWWSQFNSPILLQLIESAQKNSPTVATARVNIKTYQAKLVGTQSRNIPNLGLTSSLSRSQYQQQLAVNAGAVNTAQLGLQTSWELDLFGVNNLTASIEKLQIEQAKSSWHDARTVVAAETARAYYNYNFCNNFASVIEKDYISRTKQNNIIVLKVKAGFEAPVAQYMSEGGLAQAKNNLLSQSTQCQIALKGLIALTGISERDLIEKFKNSSEVSVVDGKSLGLYMPLSIPGDLILQRPDVFNIKNQLEQELLGIGIARGQHYPKISIGGNFTKLSISNNYLNSWSIGPLSITLPIFDGGVIRANEEVSIERYQAAKINFEATLRIAIKEIETALINLNSTEEKTTLNLQTVESYQKNYNAVFAKYKAGLATLFELEDARRQHLNSLNAQLNNQQERLNAWIDLYKALGGSFNQKDQS